MLFTSGCAFHASPSKFSQCDKDYFLDETMPAASTSNCRACPKEGVTCDETGGKLTKLLLNPGYFRISEFTHLDDEIRACPMSTRSCAGGRNFSGGGDSYCHKGYEGPLCEVYCSYSCPSLPIYLTPNNLRHSSVRASTSRTRPISFARLVLTRPRVRGS